MAVRPYIRTFDSNDYWHQLATKDVCLSIAWSSDYSVAQARAREDGTGVHLAFTLPKEGSNITYNAFLIPASAPHPEAAHKFLNFILEPKVIAEITNDIHYGNDNLGGAPLRRQAAAERSFRVSAAGAARAAVPARGTQPRLRPGPHPGLDPHQDGAIAAPEICRRAEPRAARPARKFPVQNCGFATWRMASRPPGNVSLRPHS